MEAELPNSKQKIGFTPTQKPRKQGRSKTIHKPSTPTPTTRPPGKIVPTPTLKPPGLTGSKPTLKPPGLTGSKPTPKQPVPIGSKPTPKPRRSIFSKSTPKPLKPVVSTPTLKPQETIGSTLIPKPSSEPVISTPTSNGKVMTPAPADQVLTFYSPAKWNAHYEAYQELHKLVVINFTASWSKPCDNMKPIFFELATTYSDVEFVQIDVDELMDLAIEFEVKILPTQILMKKGEIIDRVMGVKKEELQKKIEKNRRLTHQ